MMIASYLSAGAFTLAANAFLIPVVTINDESMGGLPAIAEATTPSTQQTQTINVDCSTCPYAIKSERNGQHEWTNDVSSDLEMTFSSQGGALTYNGAQIYPPSIPAPPPTLFVKQIKKDEDESAIEGFDSGLKLSYSMEYEEKKFEMDNSIVTVLMTIMGLDGEMVKVDDVEIKVIKASNGELTLHSMNTVPVDPESQDAKCGNMVCRVFTKMITGMKKAKAGTKAVAHKVKCFCMKCFSHLTGHKFPIPEDSPVPDTPNRRPDGTMELPSHVHFNPPGRPHSHHHHGGHHHRGFFRKIGHIFWATVKIAFIPILIGIAFGMAASAIGMLVGQLVVFLWVRFGRRGGEVAYEPLDTDEKEVPPPYEDVPGTEAIDQKEVEAKA